MCLIVLAWQAHPDFPLIVAANRDEFHARPTEAATWWPEYPDMLAGRDLQAGGTWLAITRSGRFATVTNYREQSFTRIDHRTRGELAVQFVTGNQSPAQIVARIVGDVYDGFNVMVGNRDGVSYISNRGDPQENLDPGIYGLSNAALDTPWAKVRRSKQRMQQLIDHDQVSEATLLDLLADRHTVDEDDFAEHLPAEQARAITAPFIVTESYGTRSSTVLLRHRSGRCVLAESRFDSRGQAVGQSRYDV
jgi:uncharacterized protein with NRDE domain